MFLVRFKVRNGLEDSCRNASHYSIILYEEYKSKTSVVRPLNVRGVMKHWDPWKCFSAVGVELSECPGNKGTLKSKGIFLSLALRQLKSSLYFSRLDLVFVIYPLQTQAPHQGHQH